MLRKFGVLSLFFAVFTAAAFPANFNGKWTAQFDTQIGTQNYTFEFHVDGTKLTGKAINAQFGSIDITDGKIDGDNISFVEPLNFQGNELRIVYTGRINGDSINFTRKVGDIATEKLTATRMK